MSTANVLSKLAHMSTARKAHMSTARKIAQTNRRINERSSRPEVYYGLVRNGKPRKRKAGEVRGRIPLEFKKRLTADIPVPLWQDLKLYLNERGLSNKDGIIRAIEIMVYSGK